MLELILSRLGLPFFVSLLADSLSNSQNTVAQSASRALRNVEAEIRTGNLDLAEANRHAEEIARLRAREYETAFAEINKSLRSEIESQDKYVRRMRPTFGYLMAFTWAAQMFGIAYVIIFDTERAGLVMSAMSGLSAIWAVGLSVLGIYVYKRSEDKKLAGSETIFWNSPNHHSK